MFAFAFLFLCVCVCVWVGGGGGFKKCEVAINSLDHKKSMINARIYHV